MQEVATTTTTVATFQINNAKPYVPVVSLSINDNIKFLENIKQGFKETISWNKYRTEITAQPKNNILDYLIDLRFRNISNKLRYFNFEPSFKLRWCRAQDLFESPIPMTLGGFELRISCI